jgi:uncharacterized protein
MRAFLATLFATALLVGATMTDIPSAAAADQKAVDERTATFEVYQDKAGEYRWRLKSSNGQNIATSGEGYSEKRSCMAAIETVKKAAANAKIEEIAEK